MIDLTKDQVLDALQVPDIYVFDAREKTDYAARHIRGAISLPLAKIKMGRGLPFNRAARVVFYCGGPTCPASTFAARAAEALGYVNVFEYKGGMEEWIRFELPVDGKGPRAEARIRAKEQKAALKAERKLARRQLHETTA
jgi:rhodanese-related sulfurtransferase